jgi:hypothetical protein
MRSSSGEVLRLLAVPLRDCSSHRVYRNREVGMAAAFTFVSNHRHNALTPFEECFEVLGEAHDENVFGAIERLVASGEQVGFTVHDLVRLLRGGMTLETLLDVIEGRMAGLGVRPESRAA